MNYDEFKKLIKYLRIANEMTQADLAEKLNVSPSTVAKWEQGQNIPPLDRFAEILELLTNKDIIKDIKDIIIKGTPGYHIGDKVLIYRVDLDRYYSKQEHCRVYSLDENSLDCWGRPMTFTIKNINENEVCLEHTTQSGFVYKRRLKKFAIDIGYYNLVKGEFPQFRELAFG